MDTFHEEIYKMADLLFLCGDRLIETESFIIELVRRKISTSDNDWRKKIAEFLDEAKEYDFFIEIMDKRTNLTFKLNQLNPLKIRNLYMELAAHLDLSEEFEVKQTNDPIIYKISLIRKL